MDIQMEPVPSFKGGGKAYRKKVETFCTKYINEVTGNEFFMRKPPSQQWFLAKQLPQDLLKRASEEVPSQATIAEVQEALEKEITTGEKDDLVDFTLRMMEHAMLYPRFKRALAEGDDPDDFITLGEMLDEDWQFCMSICSGTNDEEKIPVGGGEMTRAELATFPDGPGQGQYDNGGRRMQAVRNPPQPPPGYYTPGPRS
jgi:hypothetical protein